MGPDPAVARVRLAVRRALRAGPADMESVDMQPADAEQAAAAAGGRGVMVACSGGADSLALLAATVFELRRSDRPVVGAVVDHGLQEGSAEHTARVVAQMASLGVDETASVRVRVDPGPGGVEAGAREARYAALAELAQRLGTPRVLLGHTVDDQAESVLLGLTQGSGPRSISGMRDAFAPASRGAVFLRPLLRTVTRADTEAACRAEGVAWWEDPHNRDQRFLRARVRHVVMPLLEAELGPGVAAALARTGHLMRDDLDGLDDQAEALAASTRAAGGLEVRRVEGLPRALRSRLLRLLALEAGCPPRELTHGHLEALEGLVWERRGEPRDVDLPGRVRASRRAGVIGFDRTPGAPPGPAGPVAG